MKLNRRRFLRLSAVGLALSVTSCSLTENYPLGSLAVQVLNENNVGIQNVLLDLYKIDDGEPIYWRASSTNSSGVGVFGERDGGVIEGEYFIRIIFTTNHQLAAGETNDRPVSVREGDLILITFRAQARTVPGT